MKLPPIKEVRVENEHQNGQTVKWLINYNNSVPSYYTNQRLKKDFFTPTRVVEGIILKLLES